MHSATLQIAGDEFGLTRERVRQICRRIELVADFRPFLPILEECVRVMALSEGRDDQEIERLLHERKLTKKPFNVEGIRKAATLFLM